MRRGFVSLLMIVLIAVAFPIQAATNPLEPTRQWILLAAPELRAALDPLVAHRRGEGYQVADLSTVDPQGKALSGEVLLKAVQKQCRGFNGPSVVLLVGTWNTKNNKNPKVVVPTLAGTQLRMKGQPTDHFYGQSDKDGAVTVAVGRFPATTMAEAKAMVRKTLQLEQQPPNTLSNRITLLIGHPGGERAWQRKLAESMVSLAANTRLKQLHPMWKPACLADVPGSPFKPNGIDFSKAATKSLSTGSLITCYAGHSSAQGLWSDQRQVLNRQAFADLKINRAGGVFVSVGCFSCQTDGADGQGYSISALRNPHGPAAAIGAFGESYAALGQLALDGLMKNLARPDPPERLGDYWLAVQASLARTPMNPVTFRMYDEADGTHGRVSLADQRREHLEMWTLLGDPALKLPLLRPTLKLQVARKTNKAKQEELHVSSTRTNLFADPIKRIRATITVESRDLSLPQAKPISPSNYGHTLAELKTEVTHSQLEVSLPLPAGANEKAIVVRVVMTNNEQTVMGVSQLEAGQETNSKRTRD